MLDEETYKKELIRMFDSLRSDKYKGDSRCSGINCGKCPLYDIKCSEWTSAFKIIEAGEKWSKENLPKKYKLSKLEYDILKHISDKYYIHVYHKRRRR